ncbi:MAG: MATE family efflux transporter [Gammaproteobacteria bacterium]|nr:MATE family efflux transporter [Gammaproteobacteria bacterium]
MTALPASPREWHHRVWLLAGPIILSNMSVPLVGAVDTAVVGHLPDAIYIGAVALGAIIFNFLFWGFGFLRMGTTGFVAQAYGAGHVDEVRATLARALLLAVALGIVVVALQFPIGLLAFWAFSGSVELESLANSYYVVRVWSAPATLANYAILGCLIGIHNTRAALALQLVLNITNVFLDLLFVLGLGWGVQGVALASVISEFVALAFASWLVMRNLNRLGGQWARARIVDISRLKALLHVNINIFVRTLCLIFAFSYFTAMGTKMGEITLAANAVLLHLQHFLAYGLDGFAFAVEALAGSAYGARNRGAFRTAVRVTTIWALIVAGLFTILYAVLGTSIINVITGIEPVRLAAADYLIWVLVSPVLSVWSYQLDGIFIGTTRPVEMRNGMVLSLLVYLLAIWLFIPLLGNHGLWLSLMIFMVTRAITLGLWYPRIERSMQ